MRTAIAATFLLVALLTAEASPAGERTVEALQAKVVAALDVLVAELVAERPIDAAAYTDRLRSYLEAHPAFYGSAAALLDEAGTVTASPYVYRTADGFDTLDLALPGRLLLLDGLSYRTRHLDLPAEDTHDGLPQPARISGNQPAEFPEPTPGLRSRPSLSAVILGAGQAVPFRVSPGLRYRPSLSVLQDVRGHRDKFARVGGVDEHFGVGGGDELRAVPGGGAPQLAVDGVLQGWVQVGVRLDEQHHGAGAGVE